MFLDEIYEKSNDNNHELHLENSQIIFLFFLDNAILDKYLDIFGYFVNIDYTLIQLYSIIRKKNIPEEINEKCIHFINKYIEIDNCKNFIIRILSNKKTFDNIFKYKNISKKYIVDLYYIIQSIIIGLTRNINENIGNTDVIKSKIIFIFNEILKHIDNYYNFNINFSNVELYLFGKTINICIKSLNSIINQINKNNENNETDSNNSKLVEQIDLILQEIYSTVLPNYINSFYSRISKIFENNKDKKINFEYALDNIFLSFYLIIEIISGKNSSKKYLDLLASKINPDINSFFSIFVLFNNIDFSKNIIDSTNIFIQIYTKNSSSDDTFHKIFLEYLYSFMLFIGKLDEKNLKSVINDVFTSKEEYKTLKNLACYSLNTIKKDVSGNKLNITSSMNFGDLPLINSIGERFKEDDKKKNANQVNLNNIK
jgi:hypothetical protein